MSDPVQATKFQGAQGNAPLTPPVSQPDQQPNTVQPDTITRAEAERMAKEAEERAFQRAQGLYEKGRSRFEEKVNQQLANLKSTIEIQKKAGVNITPEQEAAMRQQVINDAFESEQAPAPGGNLPAQPAQAAPGGEPQAAAQQPGEPLDPVTAEAVAMMQAAGVTIEDNDPEAATIKSDGTMFEFLTSVQAAIQAKKQRVSVSPQAATPGLGHSSQAPSPWEGRKGLDLLKEAFSQKGA